MRHLCYIGMAAVLMSAAGAGSGSNQAASIAAANEKAGKTEAQLNAEKKPFETEILDAIAKLKHDKDDDWLEDGKPSMKRIVALAGNTEIKRQHVDAIAPDLRRDGTVTAKPADVDESKEGELINVRVRALRRGQYGGKIREPGEDFTFSGEKPSWLVVLKD